MDLGTLSLAMGSAWLSGINLYATVLALGLLQRFHVAHLPGDLAYLSHTWVLVVAGALYAIEFVADKIPAFDMVWNVLHTVVRVPIAALVAYHASAQLSPRCR